MKVYIANNTKALEALKPTHSVEAEFGLDVVEGSVSTLAHHGPRKDNPCPCLAEVSFQSNAHAVVAVSHIDLDTLGGVFAIGGVRPTFPGFWEAVAKVDVEGVHKLSEITSDPEVINRLNAFWAFSEANRVFAPRDGSAEEITGTVLEYLQTVSNILEGDEELLEAGRRWAAEKESLDKESFIKESGGVILRRSKKFTNHLYGPAGMAIVALTERDDGNNSVTVSLANPIDGVSCREVVTELWGPGAGGHDGIAGSPRDKNMTMEDAEKAWSLMVEILSGR